MARKANEGRLRKAKRSIYSNPGQKAGTYARRLGLHREAFNRILVTLNDRGVLLWEDEEGRLWPFQH